MDQLIPVVGTMALLGSALVGGVFFAFSSFVMKALAGLPPAEGIGASRHASIWSNGKTVSNRDEMPPGNGSPQ